MFRFSDNYYLRKSYLEKDQTPTQSVMKKAMSAPLANVYFNSMTPRTKVIAGLEPPLRGGGDFWYLPPEELLAGRSVLKPVQQNDHAKLGFDGIYEYGEKVKSKRVRALLRIRQERNIESVNKWKETILKSNRHIHVEQAELETKNNTKKIRKATQQFSQVYKTSIDKIEKIIIAAATAEIEQVREDVLREMKDHYKQLLRYQAGLLYDEYEAKLLETKAKRKETFMKDVQDLQSNTLNIIHDLNVEKHTTIEKLRHLLECQNLSSQIYVALKETEQCKENIQLRKRVHEEKVKDLKEEIALQDFAIQLEIEQKQKRQEIDKIWIQKIRHILKKFQLFVQYSLSKFPKYADFFLNIEKLMMLQLSEALENPKVESIIESEQEVIETSVSEPNPFYLFCDKGFKPAHVDQNLCLKHCTSNASHLPVVVVNDRYIYSACDNFEIFSEKVTQYLAGHYGNDQLKDYHNYELAVPVKYTSSMQLNELNLESSVMQILQKELVNRKKLPLECKVCKIPFCFCSPVKSQNDIESQVENQIGKGFLGLKPGNKLKTRAAELQLQREPKWESYINYVTPKKCRCTKIVRKHWEEHLPSYMRKMSPFEPPELPNYEPCKLETFKKIVYTAKRTRVPLLPPIVKEKSRKDVSTQWSDPDFEKLCTCFSDEVIGQIIQELEILISDSQVRSVHTASGRSMLVNTSSSCSRRSLLPHDTFITREAYSLVNLINEVPQLKGKFPDKDFM